MERTRWAGCRRGSSVAPEEVLPEAAPAPLEPNEEASAGGVVNNAGEFSGGQEVLGAGKKLLTGAGRAAAPTPLEPTEEASAGGVVNNAGEFSGGQEVLGAGKKLLMGAGGAAAPASAELGPEREIARVTKGEVENADRQVSSGGAKVACGDSVEMQGKPAEREDERAPAIAETMVSDEEVKWEEEEAYVFQFGTVNLPDDDIVAKDGLQFGTVNLLDDDVVANADFRGEGQEAQGSPESRRYEGGVVEKEKNRGHTTRSRLGRLRMRRCSSTKELTLQKVAKIWVVVPMRPGTGLRCLNPCRPSSFEEACFPLPTYPPLSNLSKIKKGVRHSTTTTRCSSPTKVTYLSTISSTSTRC